MDFEITVPEDLRTATRESVPHNATAHALKLWSIALKYTLRESEPHRAEVTRFVSRYADAPVEGWTVLRQGLGSTLQAIEVDASEEYSGFISRCWDTYERMTGQQ